MKTLTNTRKLCNNNLFIIFNYFGCITRQFPRVYLLGTALTLWQACNSFGKYLEIAGEYQMKEVLAAYEELKEISRILCELVGEMVICEIIKDIFRLEQLYETKVS